jgi:hypothetical protein
MRLGWKGITVTNTLAYYDMATITTDKSFLVQALGGQRSYSQHSSHSTLG